MGVGEVVARRPVVDWNWDSLVSQVGGWCQLDPVTGCWVWPWARHDAGYGIIRFQGKNWRVPRLLLYRLTGELYEQAMHSCDNPPCCNPDHLKWATRLENQQDMAQKGRSARGLRNGALRGVASHRARLTEADVLEIRRRAGAGESQRSLAQEFEVVPTNISEIVRRKSWRHLPVTD